MREASATDIFVELPDVGTFRYARRQIGDRLAIRREYLRYTQEFGDGDPDLSLYAALIATHEVLCVDCPPGWENIAALDADRLDKAFELGTLLKAKEEAIAKGAPKSGAGESPGDGGDSGVHVASDLPAGTDGSALSGNDAGGSAR
ncbi:MAG: hypothetical protein ACJ75S_07375 [Solirubrobacterales bacterium]